MAVSAFMLVKLQKFNDPKSLGIHGNYNIFDLSLNLTL